MTVLNLLAPIFLVIALGAALQRGGMLAPELISGINRLLYWVGLPAAVIHAMVTAESARGGAGWLMLVMTGATLLNAFLSWAEARAIGVSDRSRGTFVQASFRGNLSFVGLPLLLTVPGVPIGKAMLVFAPMVIVHNALTVVVLTLSQDNTRGNLGKKLGKGIVSNPIIVACVIGFGFAQMGWGLPIAIETTLGSLARMALPLALLCIGATLMTVRLGGNRRHAGLAAVHKVVLSPLIGYAMGRLAGFDDATMLTLLICLSCPTAAISFTMAKQMGGDEGLAATAVVYSAVASAVSLGVVIAVFAL
ncbi:MAG: AEC family transporter [Synoicihabitans sp.]